MVYNARLYEELELLPRGALKTPVTARLSEALCSIGRTLFCNPFTAEPQIQAVLDKDGRQRFNAYDPFTGQRVWELSEYHLRVWLEERHHHP